jgi:hypothetical protein
LDEEYNGVDEEIGEGFQRNFDEDRKAWEESSERAE